MNIYSVKIETGKYILLSVLFMYESMKDVIFYMLLNHM